MITKLNTKLENCHGIHSLDYEFDFSNRNVIALYAANGTMKTSFAKTFATFANDEPILNDLFPAYEPKLSLLADGADLDASSVLVVGPLDLSYESEKLSPFLVSGRLGSEYSTLKELLSEAENNLLTRIKSSTGIGGEFEQVTQELETTFGKGSNKLNLIEANEKLLEGCPDVPESLKYRQVFNKDIEKLFSDESFVDGLSEYIETFKQVEEASPFFHSGFGLQQATDFTKALTDTKYLDANHELLFNDPNSPENNRPIQSLGGLGDLIAEQKQLIANDSRLAGLLDGLSSKFTTKDQKSFRTIIQDYTDFLASFSSVLNLREEMMLFAISQCKDDLKRYLDTCNSVETRMSEIIELAIAERTDWHSVIDEYNDRFNPPFVVDIEDRHLAILEQKPARLTYKFIREGTKEEVDFKERSDLMSILSQGERRILYLLDIIFDIRARQREGTPTLLIVDDIADSFDYANKYAIVEYLYEISQDPNFRLIVLSHNFDFYRVICNRFDIKNEGRLLSTRSDGHVAISNIAPVVNEDFFEKWRDQIHLQPRIGIASIAFARTLSVHCGNSQANNDLTKFLHIKDITPTLTFQNLYDSIRDVLTLWPAAHFHDQAALVFPAIIAESDAIFAEDHSPADLQDKIVLSIGIRLKAEQFMISKITNALQLQNIQNDRSPQTRKLFNLYETEVAATPQNCKILKSVLMMVGESIHLNSFMFEPILDMSIANLRTLYGKVRDDLH